MRCTQISIFTEQMVQLQIHQFVLKLFYFHSYHFII